MGSRRSAAEAVGAVAFGWMIAFLLMAPLFAGLVEGDGLDVRPAFFLAGAALLVDVAAVAFEEVRRAAHVKRVQLGLLLAGAVYFVVAVATSA